MGFRVLLIAITGKDPSVIHREYGVAPTGEREEERGQRWHRIPTPFPPRATSTSTRVADASMLFSSNSLTTLPGRSITSPAAILLTTAASNWHIRDISVNPNPFSRGSALLATPFSNVL